jgi:hypothetical protein
VAVIRFVGEVVPDLLIAVKQLNISVHGKQTARISLKRSVTMPVGSATRSGFRFRIPSQISDSEGSSEVSPNPSRIPFPDAVSGFCFGFQPRAGDTVGENSNG